MNQNECLGSFGTCKICDNPVMSYLCNEPLLKCIEVGGEQSRESDYWASCANVLCPNHKGEGYAMYLPDWSKPG